MDEEKMPQELTKKIFWAIAILIIQSFIFSYVKKGAGIFLFGIIAIIFVFSSRDKKIKKGSENKFLKQDNWYLSKHKLTKEIP
jgi:Ca2+-dependent lipid-binding protein